MNKGQITFEFILLLLVLLFFLITVVNPTANEARDSTEDIQRASNAVIAGKKLASAINYAASTSPGTKIPVNVFLPKPSKITVLNKELTVEVLLRAADVSSQGCEPIIDSGPAGEYKTTCTKTIKLIQNTTLLSGNALNAKTESKSTTIFVEKTQDRVNLTEAG